MLFTELCVMLWNSTNGCWRLEAIASDASVDDVRERTGFAFETAATLERLQDPPPAAVALLAEIDPFGVRHLDFVSGRQESLDAIERIYELEARLVGTHLVPANQRAMSVK